MLPRIEKIFDIRYLYLGRTSAYRWRMKIGIATNVKRRWEVIDKSEVSTTEWVVIALKTPFCEAVEQSLLRATKRWKTSAMRGSGRSEWRDFPWWMFYLMFPITYLVSWIALVFAICLAVGAFWTISLTFLWIFN